MAINRSRNVKVPQAIQRAEEDIRRGDLGLARQRLGSLLVSRGYDSDLLERIGDICYDMKDLSQAGRYWFLSARTGDEADTAIDTFLNKSGASPDSIVQQLPRHALLKQLADYPQIVQTRIELNSLGEVIERAAGAGQKNRSTQENRGAIRSTITCLMVIALLVFVFATGAHTIFHWVFGD